MNAFEKASQEIERDRDFSLTNENAIEFLKNAKQATVAFTQERFVRKIKKLKELYPDLIEICHEENGLIVAHVPVSAIRISILPAREMSTEQREAARKRLLEWRKKKEQEKTIEKEKEEKS